MHSSGPVASCLLQAFPGRDGCALRPNGPRGERGLNPNSISIYHPGGYLALGESNVMAWEFTDGAGNMIHEEVLVDNNFVSFGFDIPLTDTLFVSVLLTNEDAMLDGEPVACLIEDYLVWGTTPGLSVAMNMARGRWVASRRGRHPCRLRRRKRSIPT